MSRSIKKGPFAAPELLKRTMSSTIEREESSENLVQSFHHFPLLRRSHIAVHDGRRHVPVYVTEDMVATAREFVPTRTFRGHSGSKTSNAK